MTARPLTVGAALLALSSPGVASTSRSSSKDAAASEHHHHHAPADNAPEPAPGDRDRDRIVRMQAALREIVRNGILGRMRVGVKVVEARTGRLFYSQRDGTLMDPASNQKVLATTTALMRLGADWNPSTVLFWLVCSRNRSSVSIRRAGRDLTARPASRGRCGA